MPRQGADSGRQQAPSRKVKVKGRGKPTRTVTMGPREADAYRTRVKGKEQSTARHVENLARRGRLTEKSARQVRAKVRQTGYAKKARDERELRDKGATRTQTERQHQDGRNTGTRLPPGAIRAGRKGSVDAAKLERGSLGEAWADVKRARREARDAVDSALGRVGDNAKRELEDGIRGAPAAAQAFVTALKPDSPLSFENEQRDRVREDIKEGVKQDPLVKAAGAGIKAATGDGEGARRDLKEAEEEALRRPLATIATFAAGAGVAARGVSAASRATRWVSVAEQRARPAARVRTKDTRDAREVRADTKRKRQEAQRRARARRKAAEGRPAPTKGSSPTPAPTPRTAPQKPKRKQGTGRKHEDRTYSRSPLIRGGQKTTENIAAALGKDPFTQSRRRATRKAKRRFDVDQRVAQAGGLLDEDRTARAHRKERRKLRTDDRRIIADLATDERVRKGNETADLRALAKHHRAKGDEEAALVFERLIDKGVKIDADVEKVVTARRARVRERDAAQRERGMLHEDTEFVERAGGVFARGEAVLAKKRRGRAKKRKEGGGSPPPPPPAGSTPGPAAPAAAAAKPSGKPGKSGKRTETVSPSEARRREMQDRSDEVGDAQRARDAEREAQRRKQAQEARPSVEKVAGSPEEVEYVRRRMEALDPKAAPVQLKRHATESKADFDKRVKDTQARKDAEARSRAEHAAKLDYRAKHAKAEPVVHAPRKKAKAVRQEPDDARRRPAHEEREEPQSLRGRDQAVARELNRMVDAVKAGDEAKFRAQVERVRSASGKLEGGPMKAYADAQLKRLDAQQELSDALKSGDLKAVEAAHEAMAKAPSRTRVASLRAQAEPIMREVRTDALKGKQTGPMGSKRPKARRRTQEEISKTGAGSGMAAHRKAVDEGKMGREPAAQQAVKAGKDEAYGATRRPGAARAKKAEAEARAQEEFEARFGEPTIVRPQPDEALRPKTDAEIDEEWGRVGMAEQIRKEGQYGDEYAAKVAADAEQLAKKAEKDPAGAMADVADRDLASPESPYEWAENPYGHPVGSPVTLDQLRAITDDPVFLRRMRQHDERKTDPANIEVGHGFDPDDALGVSAEGAGVRDSELYVGRRLTMRALGDAVRRDFALVPDGSDTPDLPIDQARGLVARRNAMGEDFVVVASDEGRALVIPRVIADRWDKHFDVKRKAPERPGELGPVESVGKGVLERFGRTVGRQYVRTVLPFSVMWHAGNVVDLTVRTALMADRYALDPRTNRAFLSALDERLRELDPRLRDEVMGSLQGHAGSRQTIHRPAWADLDRDHHTVIGKALEAIDAVRGHKVVGAPARGYTRTVDAALDGTARIERAFVEHMAGAVGRRQAKEMGGAVRDHIELARRFADELADNPDALHEFHKRTLEINGDYLTMSPGARRLTQGPVPFLNWLREANKFVFLTLPKRSPVRTAMLLQAARLTEQQRAELGLNYYITDEEARALGLPPPARGFLGGALALKGGGYFPMSPLTSFGQAAGIPGVLRGSGDDLRELAGQVAPFVSRGIIKAVKEGDAMEVVKGGGSSMLPGYKQYRAGWDSKLGVTDDQEKAANRKGETKRPLEKRLAAAFVVPRKTRDFGRDERRADDPELGSPDWLAWEDWMEVARGTGVRPHDSKSLRYWRREFRRRFPDRQP